MMPDATIDISPKAAEFIAAKGCWVLMCQSNSLLTQYFTSIDIDFFNRELHLKVLDVYVTGKPLVDSWVGELIDHAADEVLTLTQNSRLGEILSHKVFSDLRLVGHRSGRDYTEVETFVEHEIMLKYKVLENKNGS